MTLNSPPSYEGDVLFWIAIDRDIAARIQDLRPMISYEVYYFLRDEEVMSDPFYLKISRYAAGFLLLKPKTLFH